MAGDSTSDKPENYEGFVRKFLRHRGAPDFIRGFDVRMGEDSTGVAAVWIVFTVDDDLQPSRTKVREATKLATSLSQELIAKHPQRWPYVRFQAAA